jgi:N-acetyl-anhydromuramyl-L-alanine amidase AmpD
MRYDSLPQIEARFKSEAAPFLTPFSLQVPNEQLILKGQLYKPDRNNYFYPDAHAKERIVLHFTAGNLRSDMQSLTTQGRHVSVPFVIARDGTIYQLFPSANWSGHLGAGLGNQGTNNAQDKVTIGIELSNYAYLVPRDGNLETIYSRAPQNGKPGPIDEYCSLSNTAAYLKIDKPFREQSYYASYTPEQIESTIILLRYLTAKYNIPRQFLPEDKRYSTTNDVLTFKGIVSHINYRPSGKWDIGPAFDWETLISGVTVTEFTPVATARSLNFAARELSIGLATEGGIAAQFVDENSTEDGAPETTDNEGYNPFEFEESTIREITPSSGKVYALLAGINEYDQVRKLSGCLHDLQQVEDYLKNRTLFDCKIKKITDSEVTRANVVKEFEEHLGQAKKEDTVLFYFSGHGTQEDAAPMWDETDGKLECIVCYDGGTSKAAEFLLTDKELRYMIAKLYKKTEAHIVVIFDCCHSGDNTRGQLINAAFSKEKVIKRMIYDNTRYSGAFPQREWSEFVFSTEIKEDDISDKKADEFLPEGIHIQMAACESNQSAVEINGEGVFTKKLLGALDACTGNVSYNDLSSRIRQYLRFSFEQTPRIYVSGDSDRLLYTGFLNRSLTDNITIAEATYGKNGWQLNIGAIHGVDKNTKLTIINAVDASQKWTARIDNVFIDYSGIIIDGTPDQAKAHKAFAEGLMSGKILLELNNSNGNPAEMAELLDAIENGAGGQFEFQSAIAENSRSADYTLHIRSGEAVITRANDPYRPVVRPLDLTKEKGDVELVETLKHISQWHFIKQLQNSAIPEGFPEKPVQIDVARIYPDGSKKKISADTGTATFDFEPGQGLWDGAMEIKLTNTTQQSVYVAALYLGIQFSSYLEYLPQYPWLLEPGKELILARKGKDRIIIRQDDFVKEYNWALSMETLKLIVSTDEFNVKALSLGSLPAPYVLADREKELVRGRMEIFKGAVMEEEDIPAEFKGWITQTLYLVFNNPDFNNIDRKMLQDLMEYDETAYYAAGLYYDLVTDENGQPTGLKLKPEIKVPEGEKGLWGDVILWAANTIESRQRKRLYKRLKETNRLRIVAEGDSWFQYPIRVLDTIDHLYKLYAIRSFAEAGDTLENYMRQREYLDAIRNEEAQIFLVSGGGNDILGTQFQYSLRDIPAEDDMTPARYLNKIFFEKLDKLEAWYTDMFTELHNRYPNLRMLVHSYDYIIPVDTDLYPRRTSWLGKYMVRKNIHQQAVRESLIRFMVDEFNRRLEKVAAAFPGVVYYVNVREIVDRGSWYDEIHPTDAGFKLVADKFVNVIETLKADLKPFAEAPAMSAQP